MKTYIVYCPDDGEELSDGREVKTSDYSFAAELWALKYDNDDFVLLNNDIEYVDVCVVDTVSKVEKMFRVHGRAVQAYYAREITEQSEPKS